MSATTATACALAVTVLAGTAVGCGHDRHSGPQRGSGSGSPSIDTVTYRKIVPSGHLFEGRGVLRLVFSHNGSEKLARVDVQARAGELIVEATIQGPGPLESAFQSRELSCVRVDVRGVEGERKRGLVTQSGTVLASGIENALVARVLRQPRCPIVLIGARL